MKKVGYAPSFFVQVPRRNEGSCGHLLSIKPKSHVTWAVLALRDGACTPMSVVRTVLRASNIRS